jgi:hypothetical protein
MNSRRFAIPMLAVTLAAAGLRIKAARNLPQAQPAGQANAQPPSEAEIRDRAVKLAQNQHNDDNALELYERIEHQVDRTGGASPRVLGDKVYRVVPDGAGTVKLLLKSDGKPVDPAEYQRQLLAWRDLLELALKPDDSRFKAASAKWEKKKHDRADLVDGAREAFVTKWLGQEMRNGRLCDVLELEPNPKYRPHSMFQDALTRVTAKTWVDHETNQLARGEAHATRDISFGGGILGKLYRGGVFSLEQAEVAPGIWLPVRYQYDFTARKFLFPFEEHQYIEVSRYRRLGPPKQALDIVRNELATGKGAGADP